MAHWLNQQQKKPVRDSCLTGCSVTGKDENLINEWGNIMITDASIQDKRARWMVCLMRIKMMWIKSCGFHSHPISTQLNTYGRFWSDMLDSVLHHHHHQNNKWWNIFQKNAVHPSSRERLGESVTRWSCSGGSWWTYTFLRHVLLGFPYNCHPSVHLFCVFSTCCSPPPFLFSSKSKILWTDMLL